MYYIYIYCLCRIIGITKIRRIIQMYVLIRLISNEISQHILIRMLNKHTQVRAIQEQIHLEDDHNKTDQSDFVKFQKEVFAMFQGYASRGMYMYVYVHIHICIYICVCVCVCI
jgi:site-specific recombinase